MTARTDAGAECPLIELRQYTLHPHQRDVLIELFDREFIESQEELGMQVMGQFRDLDDPDRFVWLRGFADMARRKDALGAFYGGPVWATHRSVANTTMVDSDNVLLLRPAWPNAGMSSSPNRRAPRGAEALPEGLLAATIFYLREPAAHDLLTWCRERAGADLIAAGAVRQGWYVTDPGVNSFPRLPVREGLNVLVSFAMFPSEHDFTRFQRESRWAVDVAPALSPCLSMPPELHRLVPTSRSALHG